MTEFICPECKKQIWSINDVKLKPGVETPIHIHAVCYERLKEIEWIYEGLKK